MNEELTVPPEQTPVGGSMLSLRGVAEVFYKPTAFFTELVKSPKVMTPYIILIVLTAIALLGAMNLMYEFMSSTPQFREQIAKAIENAGPDKAEQVRSSAEFWSKLLITSGMFLSYSIMPLLSAALALFWGNFVFAGRASFKQLLSVFLYAQIVFALIGVARLGLQLPTQNLMADFSLRVIRPDLAPDSFMFSLLGHISVHHIWEVIVAAIGLGVVYGYKTSRAYTVSLLTVGLYSIVPLLWVGIKSIF